MSFQKNTASEIVERIKSDLEAVKAPVEGYFLICRVAGVPVLVHKYFFLVGIFWVPLCISLVGMTSYNGTLQLGHIFIQAVVVTLAIAFIVVVHEAGHFTAAWLLRVSVKATVFMPIGGAVILEPMRHGFWRRVTVLSAGIIAQAVLLLLAHLLLPKLQISELIAASLYIIFVFGNLFFALVNLIPFYGSDGYQLLAVSAEEFANALGFEDPEPPAENQQKALQLNSQSEITTQSEFNDEVNAVSYDMDDITVPFVDENCLIKNIFAKVQFHIGAAEHFQALKETSLYSPGSTERPKADCAVRALKWLLFLLPFSGGVLVIRLDLSWWIALFTLCVSLVSYITMMLINIIVYRRHKSLYIANKDKEQHTLVFTDTGMIVIKDIGVEFVKRSALIDIRESSENILIYLNNPFSVYIIPKRIFKSEGEVKKFVEAVRDKLLTLS